MTSPATTTAMVAKTSSVVVSHAASPVSAATECSACSVPVRTVTSAPDRAARTSSARSAGSVRGGPAIRSSVGSNAPQARACSAVT